MQLLRKLQRISCRGSHSWTSRLSGKGPDEIMQIATKHGARKVCIFGSVARGKKDAASDLDLLMEMEPGWSLLD